MGETTEYMIERAVERAIEKSQQATEAYPKSVLASNDVQWMKWVLSAMMAGLSLFMLFTIYTMNANFSRIDDNFTKIDARFAGIDARFADMDNSIQELVQAQKEHNDLYKHKER